MTAAVPGQKRAGPHRRPSFSAVVIGRNEGERLARCLQSLRALDPDDAPLEILYVDSGSIDGSVSLAEQHSAKVIPLQPQRPTAAGGRNAGWRAAKGEFILFLDGDTELVATFPSRAMLHFSRPEMAVVWGHRRELHPDASIYNRVLDLDWMYPPGPAPFCGGDAMFRRKVLMETGGFDETLIAGEEPELCRRILARGGAILHIDEPMTGHDLQITRLTQYWRRAVRAGHAYAEVSARFAATTDRFWSADARRNRLHALALAVLLPAGVAAAAGQRSPSLAGFMLLLAVALVARTAWKARWKSGNVWTLMLYGIHSHLQQIPIFVGQVRFVLQRRMGRRQGLVEYK